jgi:tRNA uridine 5-carboxymethylaminomethyl modification enzyme
VPEQFSFMGLPGLSRELQERLSERRPGTVALANTVPGMTPAALALISTAITRGPLSAARVVDDISAGGAGD